MFDVPFEYAETFTTIMYFAPALISLIALWFINKKYIWLSIPITIIADLIAFWNAIISQEWWQLTLVFLIPQIIVVTLISIIALRFSRKRS